MCAVVGVRVACVSARNRTGETALDKANYAFLKTGAASFVDGRREGMKSWNWLANKRWFSLLKPLARDAWVRCKQTKRVPCRHLGYSSRFRILVFRRPTRTVMAAALGRNRSPVVDGGETEAWHAIALTLHPSIQTMCAVLRRKSGADHFRVPVLFINH